MAFGFREDRRRRRRRLYWTLFKWVVALCLIGAAGYWAYNEGSRLARTQVTNLEREIDTLTTTVADLKERNSKQQTEIEGERSHANEWQQRYEREVPTGKFKEIFDLVRAKLDGGVSFERLRFVIDAAEETEECVNDPETKRFVIPTPLYRGSGDSVRFADGAIVITATGVTAHDATGKMEAWFNPAEPISVRVTHISGKEWEFAGVLPLHYQLVVDDKEYRFNIATGARGFVEVTGQTCRYP